MRIYNDIFDLLMEIDNPEIRDELCEQVDNIIITANLYQCEKCGEWNQKQYICGNCKLDESED